MGGFRFIEDLKSDVMFEAEGETLDELLEQSARAMFSVICEIERIAPNESLVVEARGEDEKSLLVAFLGRLLTESEIRGLFLSSFDVRVKEEESGTFAVFVTTAGERMTRETGGTVVKGVTYYGLAVEKTAAGYRARVALDV